VRPLSILTAPVLRITDTVALEDWELTETFHRASGPGGQNVNKVATAVALLEAQRSPHLEPAVKARLRRLAGRRWTADGAIVITSERFRSQALNREDARAKLAALARTRGARGTAPPCPDPPGAGRRRAPAPGQGAPGGGEGGAGTRRARGVTGGARGAPAPAGGREGGGGDRERRALMLAIRRWHQGPWGRCNRGAAPARRR
jgi:ribosome-associated protein